MTRHHHSTPSLRHQAIDLSLSVAGIYVCYIYYAILQEQFMQPQEDGSKFSYPLFLMLIQCMCNCIIIYPIMTWKERRSLASGNRLTEHGPSTCQMPERLFAMLALSYVMGMATSYVALEYISFPTQVLIKSCKMLPVMLIGTLVFRHKYSILEYIAVGLITIGIWAFFAFEEKSTHKSSEDHTQAQAIGIILSMVSLTCDGITGAGQDNYVSTYKPSSELLMYAMNKWSVLELLVGCFFLTNQGTEGMSFLANHTNVIWKLLIFGVTSAFGQMFIFHMVISFGALPLSITTSTRKFFTILSSVVFFGHRVGQTQWIAVAAVFTGLFLDIGKKAFNKKKKHNEKNEEDKKDKNTKEAAPMEAAAQSTVTPTSSVKKTADNNQKARSQKAQ